MEMESLIYVFFIPSYGLLFLGVLLMVLAPFNHFRFKSYKLNSHHVPFISLITPAHNEADVIERTINAFLTTKYDDCKKEMIVVNDASTDKTAEVVARHACTIIKDGTVAHQLCLKDHAHITLINRGKGGNGKAHASNVGGDYARGDILFFTDADVRVAADAFTQAARHLHDDGVAALAGYVQVAKNDSILNGFLHFENVWGQKVFRAGFNALGVHYIVPGGCAIFKKQIWNEVGGYRGGSLAEDTDLTWKVLTESGREIRFDPSIVVTADEPKALDALWNQRLRWSRGNLEVTLAHKHKIGKTKHGRGVTYVFPFWLASLLMPILFMLNAMGLILAVMMGAYSGVIATVGMLLGLIFFVSWMAGAIVTRGSGAVKGLLSPGIVLLVIFSSGIIWSDGLYGLFTILEIETDYRLAAAALGIFVFISAPFTYLMVQLSKTRLRIIAEVLQFYVFGYWMVLVMSALHGYILEALGKERKWVRTVR